MIRRLRATTFVKRLSTGRNQPCVMLCEDDDGGQETVVVKLRAAFDAKETALVCELMGSMLADDLDLPVPQPVIVDIEAGFERAMPLETLVGQVRDSIGPNFGTVFLGEGTMNWPTGRMIPQAMRPLAAEVFGFDVIVQNPDRRRNKPNLLVRGDDLFIFDHELAFSFVMGLIGGPPAPWKGQGLEFCRQHVFYDALKGSSASWDRLTGALEAVSDRRLQEYVKALPAEWKAKSSAPEQIVEYLKQARQHRDEIAAVITRLLT